MSGFQTSPSSTNKNTSCWTGGRTSSSSPVTPNRFVLVASPASVCFHLLIPSALAAVASGVGGVLDLKTRPHW